MFCLAERSPSYYAVIPASVRYDDGIPANAKLLYGEISALVSEEGFCYAKNSYFASLYRLSERTITGLLAALQKNGYIKIILERDEQGQVKDRKIYLKTSVIDGQPLENIFYTPRKNFQEGIEKNFQYTNTSITNIEKENIKESPPEEVPKEKRPRKTDPDFDPQPLFVAWINETFADATADAKNAIYLAMVRFSENREAIKKPFKSKAAVTALCHKLMRYSDGSANRIVEIVSMLDTSTINGWQGVFPPKNTPGTAQTLRKSERVYKEI